MESLLDQIITMGNGMTLIALLGWLLAERRNRQIMTDLKSAMEKGTEALNSLSTAIQIMQAKQ